MRHERARRGGGAGLLRRCVGERFGGDVFEKGLRTIAHLSVRIVERPEHGWQARGAVSGAILVRKGVKSHEDVATVCLVWVSKGRRKRSWPVRPSGIRKGILLIPAWASSARGNLRLQRRASRASNTDDAGQQIRMTQMNTHFEQEATKGTESGGRAYCGGALVRAFGAS